MPGGAENQGQGQESFSCYYHPVVGLSGNILSCRLALRHKDGYKVDFVATKDGLGLSQPKLGMQVVEPKSN